MSKTERTYDEARIAERLGELPGWYYRDGWIRRVYKTDGWQTTLMLVNAIGYLAEAAYHHPDLSVTWGRVVVKLATHSAGGITDKDFALARRIEDVALWRPPEGGALEGTPNKFVRSGDPRS
jgi:4a-hydroxytetrahydrobiopterin dehydratase